MKGKPQGKYNHVLSDHDYQISKIKIVSYSILKRCYFLSAYLFIWLGYWKNYMTANKTIFMPKMAIGPTYGSLKKWSEVV